MSPMRAPIDRTTYQHFCAKQRQRVRAQLRILDQRLTLAQNDEMVSYHIKFETELEVRGRV